MQRIAFYDLDKTITRRATFPPFIIHVLKKYGRRRMLGIPYMLLLTLSYLIGFLSRSRLKEKNLALLVGQRPSESDLLNMATTFARETVADNMLNPALAQIEADREAGYRIVIASASFRFYVAAIGKQLGILDVIATNLRTDGAIHYQPIISGRNCYGADKLVMVKDWMTREGLDRSLCHIRFYSDHVSDAPCLDWADEAFATNAHQPLQDMADAKGWVTLNWLN